MKKVLFLVAIFSVTTLFSQNTFQLWNFNAKDGMEGSIAKLADEQWGDAKFKSGGIQIERISQVTTFGRIELFCLEKLVKSEESMEILKILNGDYFKRN